MIYNIFKVCAFACLSCLPSFANAQEVTSWSGPSVGLGLANGHLTTSMYSPAQQGRADGYALDKFGGNHTYGFVQAGYNHQVGQAVLGLQLRYQKTSSGNDEMWKLDELLAANAKDITTISARAGYIVRPEILVYASVGAAFGKFHYASIDQRWGQVDDSMKANREGLMLGVGGEYRLNERISIFAEYSHISFDKKNSTFDYGESGGAPYWTYKFKHRVNSAQLGVNMMF